MRFSAGDPTDAQTGENKELLAPTPTKMANYFSYTLMVIIHRGNGCSDSGPLFT